MSRRVITGPAPGQVAVAGGGGSPPPDDYLGRLIKYIPAEIVALYLTVSGAIPSGGTGSSTRAAWIVFAACALLTPIYMWVVTSRGGGKPLLIQVILATIAFPIWVFAVGGPFATLLWYHAWVASILLAFATVVFGLIRPVPGS